ncbi:MAG: alpha/beta hydrolase, partial [Deltaproteobacteria bacterium]|nr:alpha/beta hydrolase [Deltaproteobacteria bacterium]
FAHTQALRQKVTDADFAMYKAALQQPGALTATINYYRAALRQNPLTFAKQVEPVAAETLLIWGEQDVALGRELTEGLGKLVPRLHVEYLPAGHFVHLERPDEVNRLLVEYLSRPLPIPTAN